MENESLCSACLRKRRREEERTEEENNDACSTTGSNKMDPAEVFSSPNPRPKKNRRANNFVWKPAMTHSLLQFLLRRIEEGECRNKFKLAVVHISEEFQTMVTHENVQNHLRIWKVRWGRICQVRRQLSGYGWDDENKIIMYPEARAKEFLANNSWAEGLINQPIQYYEELAAICGNDMATGEHAADDVSPITNDSGPAPGEGSGSRRSLSFAGTSPEEASISSIRRRGKATVTSQANDPNIVMFSDALGKVADVMRESKAEGKELAAILREALDQLIGHSFADTIFDADFIYWVADYLVEKPNLAWVFLGRQSEERKRWLCRQYHEVYLRRS